VKPVVIISIAVGVSVVAVLGVLIGIGAYQQAQLEKEQREANQALLNLMKKVAESKQEQPTPQPTKSTQPTQSTPLTPQNCSGNATCFTGQVTSVIDGDTLVVKDIHVRFALASAPELSEKGGIEAKYFIESLCPIGSTAFVDEDDGQTQGSYDRILAVIYCNGTNLNEAVLDKGHAVIDKEFCKVSEFSNEAWAQNHGCATKIQEDKPSDATSGIIIAEAESNPAGSDDGNEWIKLFNPSSSNKDISNWIVNSTHGKAMSFQIQSGTIFGSCEYVTIKFPLQFLDNEDESVILLDQNGIVIDKTPVFSDKSNDSWIWKDNIPPCK